MLRVLKIAMIGMGVAVAAGAGGLAVFRIATSAPPEGYGADRTADIIKDCSDCPEMLPIAPGAFKMGAGSKVFYRGLDYDSQPVRAVNIETPFAISRFEVTFAQWDACVADGGCGGYSPPDEGWGRGDLPVIYVSWRDAAAYTAWLSQKTGETYRLPTEAEWDYAARGGVPHAFAWGRWASHDYANYGEKTCCTGSVSGADTWIHTAPVGSFSANSFGVHDMAGNVYEWVEDCYRFSYDGAPADGSADLAGDCAHRRIRGGAWYSDPGRVRPSYRAYQTPDQRDYVIGFRVVREIPTTE